MDNNITYERLIDENLEKGFQVKLVLNDYKDITYIQLRKYFLTYEGEWIPSREGISVPATLENIYELLYALVDISSKAETENILETICNNLKK